MQSLRLDSYFEDETPGSVNRAMGDIMRWLAAIRSNSTTDEWQTRIDSFRDHPIHERLLEDWFTQHAFARPRGYPGDADLIDLIYRLRTETSGSQLGHNINRFCLESPSPSAVRYRRKWIAGYIDHLVTERGHCRALSVACGHLREFTLLTEPSKCSMVAFDQDVESLRVLKKEACESAEIEAAPISVRAIISDSDDVRSHTKDKFDLVYSLGLYDYLNHRVAKRLTKRLFGFLKPGGRMVLANFSGRSIDVGYMECCMDWWLTYRSEDDMLKLLSEVDPAAIAKTRVFGDPLDCINYVEVVKTG